MAVSMTDSGGEEKHTRLTKENYTLSLLDELKPVQLCLRLPTFFLFQHFSLHFLSLYLAPFLSFFSLFAHSPVKECRPYILSQFLYPAFFLFSLSIPFVILILYLFLFFFKKKNYSVSLNLSLLSLKGNSSCRQHNTCNIPLFLSYFLSFFLICLIFTFYKNNSISVFLYQNFMSFMS